MSNQARMVAEEVTDAFMESSVMQLMDTIRDVKWWEKYSSLEFEHAMGDLGGLNSVCTGRVRVWFDRYTDERDTRSGVVRKPAIEILRTEVRWGDASMVVQLQPDAEEFVRQEIERGDE